MSERVISRSTHIEELKVTQEKISNPLPGVPLVTFDLNLSNLQEYLNKVATVVNKNSLTIQALSQEMTQRVSTVDGYEMLESIALSIPSELGGRKPKAQTWKEGLSAANEGIQSLCDRIQELEQFKKRASAKLKKHKFALNSKLSQETFEHEKRELEGKLAEKVSKDLFLKKITSFEELVKKTEENFLVKIAEMEKKISEFEVNTLWKIRDCENLLKTRVNEKFVWDALAALEIKIKKEQEALAASKIKNQENRFEMLQRELKRVEEETLTKFGENKKVLNEVEKQ